MRFLRAMRKSLPGPGDRPSGEGGIRQVNLYCSRCGACADVCRKGAVRFRIKGTPFTVPASSPADVVSLGNVDIRHHVRWKYLSQ